MTHMAMAFTIAHPGVTTALLGPRTMEHLDDLLAGAEALQTDASSSGTEWWPPPTHTN